ncbi:MAG TPA: hypothetical protein VMR98_04820, partial [Candidatus Polarisedimenticolaceae bacterium]|nr:hypothetical protein [Candidatus Polarisedimenticolaceae bacterium]
MKNQHPPLTDLLNPAIIEKLALPSNWRYGKAIFKRGAVEFISRESSRVEGWAGGLDGTVAEGGGQRRRIELTA